MFDRIAEGRWWDRPLGLVRGCTPCSPGCDHCWLRSTYRRFRGGADISAKFCDWPLEKLRRARKPAAWAVWSDLFHENVKDMEISAALHVAGHASKHVVMMLTKRAARMEKWSRWFGEWPPTAWAGVTVCNQAEADEKIPLLLQVPAAVRFLSLEPMLGPVDLGPWLGTVHTDQFGGHWGKDGPWVDGLAWVILGGETGPGARPMDLTWARSVRDQCVAASVPFFFKSHGGRTKNRLLDGRTWNELPEAAHA